MKDDFTSLVRNDPNNKDLWSDWYKNLYPKIFYRNFKKCNGDSFLCEEITQGAFERFIRYKSIKKLFNDEEVLKYIYTISSMLLSDYFKKRNRESDLMENINPEELTSHIDSDVEMQELLSLLSKEDKGILDLVIQGYSTSEISRKLKITYAAAGVRVHRAKARLKKIIDGM